MAALSYMQTHALHAWFNAKKIMKNDMKNDIDKTSLSFIYAIEYDRTSN